MADEKKPKIDLKARLGKTQVGGSGAPAVSQGGALTPVPPGIAPRTPPPPAGSVPAMPPPGVPVGPPPAFGAHKSSNLDPSNPLAAVATPYRPPPVVAAAPTHQRIEVDEGAIHEARKGALKRGIVIGLVMAAIFGGVGFVAGGASEQGKAREKSKTDAQQLGEDLAKAKDTLTKLADKMDEGRKTLSEKKFPESLSKDLVGLNVTFDGSELAGRRFSGFPQDTTAQLVDFVTSVTALNDKKLLVEGLLNKLQKPLSDQFNAPAGQQTLSLIGVVSKDPAGNPSILLAPLSAPIAFSKDDVKLPAQFAFSDPLGQGNASLARYTGGDVAKNAAALPVVPKTFEKVCPSEMAGQSAQLAAQIGAFVREIKGEGAPTPDAVSDAKPGLIERADKLILGLQKVQ